MREPRKVLLVALLGCLAGGACWGASDIVVLKGGRQVVGEVVGDSSDGVSIKVEQGRVERKLPAAQVETVYYDDRPPSYREGMEQLSTGQYVEAAASFQKAMGERARPWLKVYAAYYLGESLALDRQFKPAVDAYRQCIAADAKSRLCSEAQMGVGLSQFAAGEYNPAATRLIELGRSAPDETLRQIAQLSLANLHLVQDKAEQARSIYQGLKLDADKQPVLAGTCELGQALIGAKAGAAGSDAALEKALNRPAANVLKYLAWKLAAQKAYDAKQYEEAMMGYLRADFYLSRRGAGDTFVRSALDLVAAPGDRGELLFKAASCAELLKKNHEAMNLYEAVGKAGGSREWADKAAQQLKRLQ